MKSFVKLTFIALCALFLVQVVSQSELKGQQTLTCTTEQNGKSAKITCTLCPGSKDDFFGTNDGVSTSDADVVGIESTTKSNVKVEGKDCGQLIVQLKKKKAGNATVTIDPFGDTKEDIDFNLTDELFSMAVPGGASFGTTGSSTFEFGETKLCALKIISTATELDTMDNGSATATLIGSGFTFDGGLLTQAVSFVNGQASINVHNVGPSEGAFAYLQLSDDGSLGSIGETDTLHTASILLTTPDRVPSLTTYGLIALALLLAGTAVWMFRRRRVSVA
jgi:hypothetical protein